MARTRGTDGQHGLRLRGEADGEKFTFVLERGDTRIGSHDDNDIVIKVPGLSRRHAILRWTNDGLRLEDLGSKNGTLINGVRLRRGEPVNLKAGGIICLGPAVATIEAIDPGEAEIAIAGAALGFAEKPRTPRRSGKSTASERDETVPARWLGIVTRIAALRDDPHGVDHGAALEILATSLGASGAASVEVPRRGEIIVVRGCGDFAISGHVAAAVQELSRGLCDEAGAAAHANVGDAQTPPCSIAAVRRGDMVVCALVVVGDAARLDACGRLLESVLRLIEHDEPHTPAPAPARMRRPVPDLVFPNGYVVGRSDAMASVHHQLRHLVGGTIPILITGETGAGKELIAHTLHQSSPRAAGPFVAVNCAAIPADLLEAELFGIESGVATGVTKREGKMQLARGGTIFLDEIGDMSPALQAKLLRALQEQEVHPVGARKPVALDVRVVAATNTDLQERIADGRFRADLYYRVAGYTLHVPALRARREDIPGLVEQMMNRVAAEVGKHVRGISVKALEALVNAPWPGNVRELEHEIRRLVYLCPPGQPITSSMLSASVLAPHAGRADADSLDSDLHLGRRIEELQRTLVTVALERAKGNQAHAARLLGVSRFGLRKMIERLGITR